MLCGIHLLYKKEITMISQYWLSLVNNSTIVDVEEERRYTSKQRHFQHYGIYQDKRNECGEEGTFIV